MFISFLIPKNDLPPIAHLSLIPFVSSSRAAKGRAAGGKEETELTELSTKNRREDSSSLAELSIKNRAICIKEEQQEAALKSRWTSKEDDKQRELLPVMKNRAKWMKDEQAQEEVVITRSLSRNRYHYRVHMLSDCLLLSAVSLADADTAPL